MDDVCAKKLVIYMRNPSVTTLGPGIRYTIWVQGCPLACVGCLVPDSHDIADGERVALETLSEEISSTTNIEGITFSGGEPFAQALALAMLIKSVRLERDLGLIVYTGYSHQEIISHILSDPNGGWAQLYSQIDLLIDGRYVERMNDDKPLRGSSNQRAIPITDRYLKYVHLYGADSTQRAVTVSYEHETLTLIGVPSQSLLRSLQAHGYISNISMSNGKIKNG